MNKGLPALASLRNGASIPRASIPCMQLAELRAHVIGASDAGGRIAALVAWPLTMDGNALELCAVIASDGEGLLRLGRAAIEGPSFPSMTRDCPEVHLFERAIAETWSVVPEGHPWLKPVRFPQSRGRAAGDMDFYRVAGDEVHEVAVGPVHAGVIEPGHFRFQCHGEQVFHLEISLGYQHRGVTRALVSGPHKRSLHHMETLAGDTSVGHATAYCEILESLSRSHISARAQALRAVALELERLANHTGTLGALANDVGFLPTASFCGRLRGDFLNLTAEICGNRFGRGMVKPGGVGFDVEPTRAADLTARLDKALRDVDEAATLLLQTPSVQARFEGTGLVDTATALSLGLVGVAARASGLLRDVRHDFPSGIYRFSQLPVTNWPSGDVFARAYVRFREIQRSSAFVRAQLAALPKGALCTAPPALAKLAPDHLALALVEGFRGEICHAALTDSEGRFLSYTIVDPSFHNWSGLAMAQRGEGISDFPLCNKSFDLSYCGFDL